MDMEEKMTNRLARIQEADMVDKVRAMVTAILEETVPSTEGTFSDGYKTGQRILAGAIKIMLNKAG